ncbi:hypothetical protein F4818DRAFT_437316 [Hypoxylon cercidicola]|nr:hypothetical protein F4818DRAFT_437316 [Hypoxylon cercidicola]
MNLDSRDYYYDGHYSSHPESFREPQSEVYRQRREADGVRAMQNYRYSGPYAPLPVPRTRSPINHDVPLALVPGSGYGGWEHPQQERPLEEQHLWLDAPTQRDPTPSLSLQPRSIQDYTSPAPHEYTFEHTYVSFPRWEDKPYVSSDYCSSETTDTTAWAQMISNQTASPRPAGPVSRSSYISEFGAIDIDDWVRFTPSPVSISNQATPPRLATPIERNSYQVSEFGAFDVDDGRRFAPSPISELYQTALSRPTTSARRNSYQVSEFGAFDIDDGGRFTPSPVSRSGDNSEDR